MKKFLFQLDYLNKQLMRADNETSVKQMLKNVIILITINLYFLDLAAQIEQPVRYELKKINKENYYSVVSAHEFGIVIFRESNEKQMVKEQLWEVIMLDTDLNEKWKKDYRFDNQLSFVGYEYRNNYFYLLFRKNIGNKDNFNLEQINLSNGNSVSYTIDNLVPLELEEFTIAGQTAIFGGYSKGLPAILLYSLKERKTKVLPGFYKKNTYLIDLNVDDASNNFHVVLSEKESFNQTILSIKSFNQNGGLLSENRLNIENKKHVISAKTTSLSGNRTIVTGTYGSPNSDLSKGVFFINLSLEQEPEIKYFDFTELDNYLNYLPDRKEQKIKEKIVEKQAKGKQHIIRSRIILHELIPEKGHYIMLAEMYSSNHYTPLIHNYYQPYWVNSFNEGARGFVRRLKSNSGTQPVSYEYTQAIILGFSEGGDLLWDNSIKIDDVNTAFLDQIVNISTSNSKAVLVYKRKNELISKIIEGGTVIEDNLVQKIKMLHQGDETTSIDGDFGGLNYWYENKFFSWGYHWIKNKQDQGVEKRRNVFYINKISIK